jgi:hypothetical protein
MRALRKPGRFQKLHVPFSLLVRFACFGGNVARAHGTATISFNSLSLSSGSAGGEPSTSRSASNQSTLSKPGRPPRLPHSSAGPAQSKRLPLTCSLSPAVHEADRAAWLAVATGTIASLQQVRSTAAIRAAMPQFPRALRRLADKFTVRDSSSKRRQKFVRVPEFVRLPVVYRLP